MVKRAGFTSRQRSRASDFWSPYLAPDHYDVTTRLPSDKFTTETRKTFMACLKEHGGTFMGCVNDPEYIKNGKIQVLASFKCKDKRDIAMRKLGMMTEAEVIAS